ncbi:MAG: ribonuclease HIII [Bacillota bacterium]
MTSERFTPRVGLDESGKGDYFGPLVAAAAAVVDSRVELELARLGVADSKRISDGRCLELAEAMRGLVPARVVVIGPARYNELYGRMQNVNRILAWAHARALEDLLAEVSVERVVADQFAKDPGTLDAALMARGRTVSVRQLPHAEADLAVAAASVIARARFLRELDRLSELASLELPKGATHVEAAAVELVRRGGLSYLGRFAKLHFATTKRVMAFHAGAPEAGEEARWRTGARPRRSSRGGPW